MGSASAVVYIYRKSMDIILRIFLCRNCKPGVGTENENSPEVPVVLQKCHCEIDEKAVSHTMFGPRIKRGYAASKLSYIDKEVELLLNSPLF